MFSAFNPSLRSSRQRPSSTRKPTPDLTQYLGKGNWLEIHLTYMFWCWGKTEHSEKTHANTKKTQTHRKVLPQPGIKPRTRLLWGYSANHQPTTRLFLRLISNETVGSAFPSLNINKRHGTSHSGVSLQVVQRVRGPLDRYILSQVKSVDYIVYIQQTVWINSYSCNMSIYWILGCICW